MQIGFAAADGITGLKLVELGVPKDKFALMAIPLTPLQILLPWVLGKYTAGPRPMNVFQKAYPYKCVLAVGGNLSKNHFLQTFHLLNHCCAGVYYTYVAIIEWAISARLLRYVHS